MKKLIILFITLWVALFTCGCNKVQHLNIIRIVYQRDNINNAYEVDGGAIFYAPKGLYNVGDTVKFCK